MNARAKAVRVLGHVKSAVVGRAILHHVLEQGLGGGVLGGAAGGIYGALRKKDPDQTRLKSILRGVGAGGAIGAGVGAGGGLGRGLGLLGLATSPNAGLGKLMALSTLPTIGAVGGGVLANKARKKLEKPSHAIVPMKKAAEGEKRDIGERAMSGAGTGLGIGSLAGLVGGGLLGGLNTHRVLKYLENQPMFGRQFSTMDKLKYILQGALSGGTRGAIGGGLAGAGLGAGLGTAFGKRTK